MKKSKQITITYNDNEYTLEYNREALVQMENWGFNINEYSIKPAKSLILAFRGAFYMHHSNLRLKDIEDIFNDLKDKEGLSSVLADMMNDCYQSLMNGDKKEEETKKASWKIVE